MVMSNPGRFGPDKVINDSKIGSVMFRILILKSRPGRFRPDFKLKFHFVWSFFFFFFFFCTRGNNRCHWCIVAFVSAAGHVVVRSAQETA